MFGIVGEPRARNSAVRHRESAEFWGLSDPRAFALESGDTLFAEQPAEVGSGTVNDPANRTQLEIDVVAMAAQQANSPRRILSLGEVKWGEVMGRHHLQRLATVVDLARLYS
ncbi:hypothetical protein ACIA5C_02445 [Actinoplanes sp. NPDC051343]|uniref:hypothetical protein n=1 Tax=Actinoplanes sp. NPDC051343 TaxID=3363906 RepID=UPI003792C1FD